jgi:hypothetical protein
MTSRILEAFDATSLKPLRLRLEIEISFFAQSRATFAEIAIRAATQYFGD